MFADSCALPGRGKKTSKSACAFPLTDWTGLTRPRSALGSLGSSALIACTTTAALDNPTLWRTMSDAGEAKVSSAMHRHRRISGALYLVHHAHHHSMYMPRACACTRTDITCTMYNHSTRVSSPACIETYQDWSCPVSGHDILFLSRHSSAATCMIHLHA